MNKVIQREMIVPNLHHFVVEAPDVAAKVEPGQFVIVRGYAEGERIPLTVSDWDKEKGTITIIFMEVGASTGYLASLQAGDTIATCAGPLGEPTKIENFGSVMCVGGCYGIGSIYPISRALKEAGNEIVTVLEARSSYLLYWMEKHGPVSDRIVTITRDGSLGLKGHVDHLLDVIHDLPQLPNRIIVNGCTGLMMRVSETTKPFAIETRVSLNPIMIDGTGMCGVCRVTVDGQTKFACVDGPEFDGHKVDWQELVSRRQAYMEEEVVYLSHTDPVHEGRRRA